MRALLRSSITTTCCYQGACQAQRKMKVVAYFRRIPYAKKISFQTRFRCSFLHCFRLCRHCSCRFVVHRLNFIEIVVTAYYFDIVSWNGNMCIFQCHYIISSFGYFILFYSSLLYPDVFFPYLDLVSVRMCVCIFFFCRFLLNILP